MLCRDINMLSTNKINMLIMDHSKQEQSQHFGIQRSRSDCQRSGINRNIPRCSDWTSLDSIGLVSIVMTDVNNQGLFVTNRLASQRQFLSKRGVMCTGETGYKAALNSFNKKIHYALLSYDKASCLCLKNTITCSLSCPIYVHKYIS